MCREGCENARTPDSLRCVWCIVKSPHRLARRPQQTLDARTTVPLCPMRCVRCTLLALARLDSTPDAKGQRLVPPRTACGVPKNSIGAIENMVFIFSKALNPASQWRERGTQTPLNLRNFTSFAKVLTPPSVHHQSTYVLAFHKQFTIGVRLALY